MRRTKKVRKGGEMTPSRATKVVRNFMKNTETKRKARFLSSICADSGVCISFGKEIDKINKFFGHYTDFKYAVYPVRQLGIPSANGFIKEIKYVRENYEAYAILKSSVHEHADNLMYEYEVGQFINKQNKIFPCFVETYGLFLHADEGPWMYLKKSVLNQPEDIMRNLHLLNAIDYKVGCARSKYIAILIQHIKHALAFNTFIQNTLFEKDFIEKKSAINWDMPCILYQIYFALSSLKDTFTHYDLHPGNVQLYEPVKGSYITYNYYLQSGEVVRFNSKYIAKIIDFGRSFYNNGTDENSKNTYDHLCNTVPFCGAKCGLKLLDATYSQDNLTPQIKNESSDLRLLSILNSYMSKGYKGKKSTGSIEYDFASLLGDVVFTGKFGTPEIKQGVHDQICNVRDALIRLSELMKSPSITKYQADYIKNLTKLGDFHIYENKPMTFELLSSEPLINTGLRLDPLSDEFTTYMSQTPKLRSPLHLSLVASKSTQSRPRGLNFLSKKQKSSSLRSKPRSPLHLSLIRSSQQTPNSSQSGSLKNQFHLSLPQSSQKTPTSLQKLSGSDRDYSDIANYWF